MAAGVEISPRWGDRRLVGGGGSSYELIGMSGTVAITWGRLPENDGDVDIQVMLAARPSACADNSSEEDSGVGPSILAW